MQDYSAFTPNIGLSSLKGVRVCARACTLLAVLVCVGGSGFDAYLCTGIFSSVCPVFMFLYVELDLNQVPVVLSYFCDTSVICVE